MEPKVITWKTMLRVLNICKAKFSRPKTLNSELDLFKIQGLNHNQVRDAFKISGVHAYNKNLISMNDKFEFMFFLYLNMFGFVTKTAIGKREQYMWNEKSEIPNEDYSRMLLDSIFKISNDNGIIMSGINYTEEINKIKKLVLPFFKVEEPHVYEVEEDIEETNLTKSWISLITSVLNKLYIEIRITPSFSMNKFESDNNVSHTFGISLSEMNIIKYQPSGWSWISPYEPNDDMASTLMGKMKFKSILSSEKKTPTSMISPQKSDLIIKYLKDNDTINTKVVKRICYPENPQTTCANKLLLKMEKHKLLSRIEPGIYSLPNYVPPTKIIINDECLYSSDILSVVKTQHTKKDKILFVVKPKYKIENFSSVMDDIRNIYSVGYSHFTKGFNFDRPIEQEEIKHLETIINMKKMHIEDKVENIKIIKIENTDSKDNSNLKKVEQLIIELTAELEKKMSELKKTEEKLNACIAYVKIEEAAAEAKNKLDKLF